MTSFQYLPPVIIPAVDYAEPEPKMSQPVFALPRKGKQIWAVPNKLDALHNDWSITGDGEIVRVPLHSPSGGFNTADARDVSMIAAAIAIGFELAYRFNHRFEGYPIVKVQLVIGDRVHEFQAGTFAQIQSPTFRFYVGAAFEIGGDQ